MTAPALSLDISSHKNSTNPRCLLAFVRRAALVGQARVERRAEGANKKWRSTTITALGFEEVASCDWN